MTTKDSLNFAECLYFKGTPHRSIQIEFLTYLSGALKTEILKIIKKYIQ
jgi:hypothetical protein